MQPEPFEDSRRLTGANLYFATTGAALETLRGLAFDETTLERWQDNIAVARTALGWPEGETRIRRHRSGASLAFTAPFDQLYAATEINEWAWWSAFAFPFSPREKVAEGRMREKTVNDPSSLGKKLPLDPETLQFIRDLRKESSQPEHLIWSFVRNRRLHRQKFRRQKPIGPYVLDFYCHELRLAIELDGSQHNEPAQSTHDGKRDDFVASQGITTLRYWNHDVLQRTEDVLADVWHQVEARVAGHPDAGEIFPSSALRAPSPGGRREEPVFFHAPGHAAVWDTDSALHTLRRLAAAEARPALVALKQAAIAHGVAFLADDDEISLGEGDGSRTWFTDELPSPATVPWNELHDIPATLVTGSNGKTTTVRLLAAMTRAHGWPTAHSCTDGVFFEGQALETGDFSGPTGARTALRHPGAHAAILETARGGMLRRGLAVEHANAAVVTNIAADHFGEYGIHGLDDLADVKLTVARAIGPTGRLVLNADDAVLTGKSAQLTCPLAWFALDFDHPGLAAHRANGGATCGVRDGQLLLSTGTATHDLGRVQHMPLTLSGQATYNIANIAAASLAADALGIAPATMAKVLARFGLSHADNPGRLQQWRFGGLRVYIDYAHNPDGLRGLLEAVGAGERTGRLAVLLGHAGNREDADLRAVASTAAGYRPERIWLKDIGGYERGREAGEIPAIMRGQLLADGVAEAGIQVCLDEAEAARAALEQAHDGDLVVLPIHEMAVRGRISQLLDQMQSQGWMPGAPLP